jgi:hypothetical protein
MSNTVLACGRGRIFALTALCTCAVTIGCTNSHSKSGAAGSSSGNASSLSSVSILPASQAPGSGLLRSPLPTSLPPTPTPTTTAAPSDLAAAQTFLQSYFAALNTGMDKNDYAAPLKMFIPGCNICRQQLNGLLTVKAASSTVKGGRITVVKLVPSPGAVAGTIDVAATVGVAAGSILSPGGKATTTFNAIKPAITVYELTKQANAWIITGAHKG